MDFTFKGLSGLTNIKYLAHSNHSENYLLLHSVFSIFRFPVLILSPLTVTFFLYFFLVVYIGLPQRLSDEEYACNTGDARDWIWSLSQEDNPGEGKGNLLQYSCLGISMDRGDWWLKSVGLQRIRHVWAWAHIGIRLCICFSLVCVSTRLDMEFLGHRMILNSEDIAPWTSAI